MKPQRVHIVIDTPADLKAKLQAIADGDHRTLSNLVKHILESYISGDLDFIWRGGDNNKHSHDHCDTK